MQPHASTKNETRRQPLAPRHSPTREPPLPIVGVHEAAFPAAERDRNSTRRPLWSHQRDSNRSTPTATAQHRQQPLNTDSNRRTPTATAQHRQQSKNTDSNCRTPTATEEHRHYRCGQNATDQGMQEGTGGWTARRIRRLFRSQPVQPAIRRGRTLQLAVFFLRNRFDSLGG